MWGQAGFRARAECRGERAGWGFWGLRRVVEAGSPGRGSLAWGGSGRAQAVQALDVQGQTHQIPLALDRAQAAHAELAKAQDALDPADGRFHQPFALGIRFLPLWACPVWSAMRRVAGPWGRRSDAVFLSRPSAT